LDEDSRVITNLNKTLITAATCIIEFTMNSGKADTFAIAIVARNVVRRLRPRKSVENSL